MKRNRIVLALVALVAALCFVGAALAETTVLLGSTQTSWSNQLTLSPGYADLIATKFTATATAGTATANFYLSKHTDTEVVGVYADNSGSPGALLGQATLPSGTGWKVVAFTGVSLTQGDPYWIAELQTTNVNPYAAANSYPIDGNITGAVCNDEHPAAVAAASFTSSLPSTFPSGSSAYGMCAHGFVIKG